MYSGIQSHSLEYWFFKNWNANNKEIFLIQFENTAREEVELFLNLMVHFVFQWQQTLTFT